MQFVATCVACIRIILILLLIAVFSIGFADMKRRFDMLSARFRRDQTTAKSGANRASGTGSGTRMTSMSSPAAAAITGGSGSGSAPNSAARARTSSSGRGFFGSLFDGRGAYSSLQTGSSTGGDVGETVVDSTDGDGLPGFAGTGSGTASASGSRANRVSRMAVTGSSGRPASGSVVEIELTADTAPVAAPGATAPAHAVAAAPAAAAPAFHEAPAFAIVDDDDEDDETAGLTGGGSGKRHV